MDARWRIEVLGRLRATRAGQEITRFRTHKTGALLAYLAYHRDRTHPREMLIDLFWPDCVPEAGRNNLSKALSSLRYQLEPAGTAPGAVLLANRGTVGLNPEAVITDAAELEAAAREAVRSPNLSPRVQLLTDTVELYSGELLPAFYDEWIFPERDRLADLFFQCLRRLVTLLEESGEPSQAIQYARRGVTADPLREGSYVDVMRLLLRSGQPGDALRYFREMERLFQAELDTTPSAAARRLASECEMAVQGSPTPPASGAAHSAGRPQLAPLPTGTVTFLLADAGDGDAGGREWLDRLAPEIRRSGGREISPGSIPVRAVFARAADAVACAAAYQKASEKSANGTAPGVRMAVDTGDVELLEGEYLGSVVARGARLLRAAHPAQILCSEETAILVRHELKAGVELRDLGSFRLRSAGVSGAGYDPSVLPSRLFQVVASPESAPAFPPPDAAVTSPNLPLDFTKFVGRRQELNELTEMLCAGETRLVTLMGPGGSGKTRLALEAARLVSHSVAGAVWFVPLATVPVLQPGGVAEAVREALQLRGSRGAGITALDQVAGALGGHGRAGQPFAALLVLDNMEHLLDPEVEDDGAGFVAALLARVANLKCLVTSRRPLGLPGEREFWVNPLPVPSEEDRPEQLTGCDSVQLFLDRAQTVRPDFQVTRGNAPAVAAICNRLEGMPLALELAAARSQVLTPGQMLPHLEDRLDLLGTRPRGARRGEARHHSLRAAIEWSYRLLTEEQKRLFSRLSVFEGGWTLEGAAAVCLDDGPTALAAEALGHLRDRSMISSAVESAADEEEPALRFRMLECLRQFGAERLDPAERSDLQARHARYYAEKAEHASALLTEDGEDTALARFHTEAANLRCAWAWAEVHDSRLALRLAIATAVLEERSGTFSAARERMRGALAAVDDAAEPQRAAALYWCGRFSLALGEEPSARAELAEALRLARKSGDRKLAAAIGEVLRSGTPA